MKQIRNLDLIRDLLLDLEGVEEVDLSKYSQDEIKYNKYLIVDAGLAEGKYSPDPKVPQVIFSANIYLLTASGQDFLADARNPGVWKAAMAKIAEKGLADVSLAVVKAVLSAAALDKLGLT